MTFSLNSLNNALNSLKSTLSGLANNLYIGGLYGATEGKKIARDVGNYLKDTFSSSNPARYASPLGALMLGSQKTPDVTPILDQARKSLEIRGSSTWEPTDEERSQFIASNVIPTTAQAFSTPPPGSFSSITPGTGTTLSGQTAPVAGANNPPGKTSIGGSTGIGYGGGVGGAGYSSGAVGISGQAAPVAGANLPPPPTSINNAKPVGQFEAMIRALQKLNPQSGYIQTPLEGGFGAGYGMGNALKRIREYQTMYNR
jgi:hypothetical protein